MSRRGSSLIEVALCMALLLTLLGGLYMVLLTGMRYFQQAQTYSTVQQEAIKAMARVVREASNSIGSRITTGTESVWMLSTEPEVGVADTIDFNPIGIVYWKKWVCYYRDAANNTLVRSEIGIAHTTNPGEPAPVTLANFQAAGRRRDVVARNIATFAVSLPPDMFGTLQIQVRAQDQVAIAAREDSQKTSVVNFTTRIFLKNSN